MSKLTYFNKTENGTLWSESYTEHHPHCYCCERCATTTKDGLPCCSKLVATGDCQDCYCDIDDGYEQYDYENPTVESFCKYLDSRIRRKEKNKPISY